MSHSPKQILLACQLSFQGASTAEVAKEMGVSEHIIYRWRKMPLWKEFENELIDAEKRTLLTQLDTEAAGHAATG